MMYYSVVCSTFSIKCSWDGELEGRNCFCVWSFWCSEHCSVDQTVKEGVCWMWRVWSDFASSFAHSGWVVLGGLYIRSAVRTTLRSLLRSDLVAELILLKSTIIWTMASSSQYTVLSCLFVTLDHKTLSRWGIFVAIAKNTLYGSKLLIFLLC